jgi:asparagine synthase (glutamine-hydrolysing)
VAALGPARQIDLERITELVCAGEPVDGSATCYRAVSRVESCQTLVFTPRGRVASKQVAAWPARRADGVERVADDLRRSFLATLERMTRPFARVGVVTGGGLDSGGLLAALVLLHRRGAGPEVQAYAMDFDSTNGDRPHLQSLAAHLGLSPTRVKPADAGRYVRRSLVIDGAPLVLPGVAVALDLGARAAQQGAEALLTGVGGDEVADGDMSTFSARARRGDLLGAVIDAARLRTPNGRRPFAQARDLVLRELVREALPPALLEALRRLLGRRRPSPAAAPDWAGPRLRRYLAADTARRPSEDFWSSLAADWVFLDAADSRGQLDTATGVPTLFPFLEAEYVDFLASVPPEMFFHDHRLRGLFRHAMRGILPESLRLREDKAEFEPLPDAIADVARDEPWFRELLRMEALGDLGIVEPERFRSAVTQVREHRDGRCWFDVWPAIAVEAFVRGLDGDTRVRAGEDARP